MISQLKGIVLEKTTHSVVLDVNGVGYELEIPVGTSFALPERLEEVQLFTHFVVREDAQLLYGFIRRADRDTFRILIKINGVGPKVAVSILSGLDGDALALCVENENIDALVKLPGIGKKTAERLLIELRGKLKAVEQSASSSNAVSEVPATDSKAEAAAALEALGYKAAEAEKLIKKIYNPESSVEELIKAALKALHK